MGASTVKSFPNGEAPAEGGLGYCAIGIVRDGMTDEHAGVGGAIVGDGDAAVGRHDVGVEVDEPFAADGSAGSAHTVRGVTGGTTEAGVDVAAVLIPACVLHDLVGQVMAFSAEGVRPIHTQVRIGKLIGDQSAWCRGLAELVIPLEDVRPL